MNIITLILDFLYKVFYGLNSLDLLIIALLLGLLCYWVYRKGYDNGKRAPKTEIMIGQAAQTKPSAEDYKIPTILRRKH